MAIFSEDYKLDEVKRIKITKQQRASYNAKLIRSEQLSTSRSKYFQMSSGLDLNQI